jgi:hypothetical protein
MNGINANIPVINMPQVSSHQSDVVRAPMVHQQQNADISRDSFEHQMRIAREAEAAEGKTIDPEDKREEERKGKKRHKGEEEDGAEENGENPPETAVEMTDSGRLIDLEA